MTGLAFRRIFSLDLALEVKVMSCILGGHREPFESRKVVYEMHSLCVNLETIDTHNSINI